MEKAFLFFELLVFLSIIIYGFFGWVNKVDLEREYLQELINQEKKKSRDGHDYL